MAGSRIIDVEDVHYEYRGGIVALRGVSISIDRGEFIAILGQNGSGKTTLAKHMNGLLKPTRGRVLVDGVDTRKLSVAEASRKVGYVFQNPEHQIFANSILEEVAFGIRNLGLPMAELTPIVEGTLKLVGLEKPLDFFPHFLSVGEKHRLAMASVLVTNPEVIILDEPTTGIDFKRCLEIVRLLTRLNVEGKTIILITHDLYLAAEYARRMIVLRDGLKVADGRPEDILSDELLLQENSLLPLQVTLLSKSLRAYGIRPNIVRASDFVESFLDLLGKASR